ncbi:MAG: ferredoxin-type protein NapH [Rhodothermales bacterium]|jgi:ferredoxin-type protein NapH
MSMPVQIIRQCVRLAVLAFIIAVPTLTWYRMALNQHAEAVHEDGLGPIEHFPVKQLDRGLRKLSGSESTAGQTEKIQEQLSHLQGNSWSAQIMGMSLTDPLAVAEGTAMRRGLSGPLWMGVWIPLVLTVLFGRVFCGWICPAGFIFELADHLRRVLRRLDFRPKNFSFKHSRKFSLLGACLLVAFVTGAPVLSSTYPPAIVCREIHTAVIAGLDSTVALTISGTLIFFVLILLAELVVSRRMWCRYLCPGGAIYSALGAARLFRIKRDSVACTDCADCITACPMGLDPMHDQMGAECDSCMLCIHSCNDDALKLLPITSRRPE